MNPDYFEKLLANYPDLDDWGLRCYEKRKWYEKMTKKEEYFNDLIKGDLEWPNLYDPYFEKINDLPKKLRSEKPAIDLKVGQLVKFREAHGNGDISKGEIGIIVDMRTLIADEVQILMPGGELIWSLSTAVETIND